MNILTVQLGNNASALLVQKGCVVGAISQERFDNIKGSDSFPKEAIDWLLARGGITRNQIDLVGVCKGAAKIDFKEIGISPDKIKLIDHHLCHAFAPLAFFEKTEGPWLIFTADGQDEGVSSTVNIWDGNELRRVAFAPPENSLGKLYGAVASCMGMGEGQQEGKIMGLAAYARKENFEEIYDKIFKDLFFFDQDNLLIFQSRISMGKIKDYLIEKAACGVRFDYLAGALQHCLEQVVLQWIRNVSEQTGITQIMTSGGVFTNVRLNKLIREMPEVTATRFMPSCGNETNVFGAAYALCTDLKPVENLFLGPEYRDKEIETFLQSHPARDQFSFIQQPDIEQAIATLLAERKIVARFAGRAEFGARSLGNRAILAHPADRESFYTSNDQIKARDFWMPFAPTILDVDSNRYIVNPKEVTAPYMIDSFDTTTQGRKDLCAAMHQADKTVRPQILTRRANPEYYKLIEAFKKKTKIGALMNTSFNLHGYPLASTLDQALLTMLNSDLRYLAIGSWLVEKKTNKWCNIM